MSASQEEINRMLDGNYFTHEQVIADQALLSLPTHDDGNAECVNVRYPGRFSYNKSFGWMAYTGTHWKHDADLEVGAAVTETLKARLVAASSAKEPEMYKHILSKCLPNANRVHAAMSQLTYKVKSDPNEFNKQPDMLNCLNGVVNLRTGEMIAHHPTQRFTYCVNAEYKPNASREVWQKWLGDTVGEQTSAWLKLATGYSITGSTKEEVLFYLFGPPRSGKGTFTETMLALLGSPLGEAISFGILTAARDVDTQNFMLAPLHSSRFISASESNQYERFNEAKLKTLTGGDSIPCSFKHKMPFNYRPQFKIWLSSNQPVNADPDDDATWGRLRIVPFPNSNLGDENKDLKEYMRSPEVLEGVLAWAVEGAIEWYRLGSKGLPELESGKKIKSEHRSELDNVQAWIEECCSESSGSFTSLALLQTSYETWCDIHGVEAKRKKGFSQSLTAKGYKAKRTTLADRKTVRGFEGLTLS